MNNPAAADAAAASDEATMMGHIVEAYRQLEALRGRIQKLEEESTLRAKNGDCADAAVRETKKVKRAKLFADECERLGIPKAEWTSKIQVSGVKGCAENSLCMNACKKRHGEGVKEGQRNMLLVNNSTGHVRVGKCCSSCIRLSEDRDVKKDGPRYKCQFPGCEQEGVVALVTAEGNIVPRSLSCGRHPDQPHHRHVTDKVCPTGDPGGDEDATTNNECMDEFMMGPEEIDKFLTDFMKSEQCDKPAATSPLLENGDGSDEATHAKKKRKRKKCKGPKREKRAREATGQREPGEQGACAQ